MVIPPKNRGDNKYNFLHTIVRNFYFFSNFNFSKKSALLSKRKKIMTNLTGKIKVDTSYEDYFSKISKYIENHPEYDESIEETCGSWVEYERVT
tara:strand:- start:888 stop:1169 length:282 start_codon:yes stop_codon:yes gene_type:complete